MKNVLFVVPGDKLAGAEKVLLSIALELYKRGYKIIVLIWFIDKDKTGQWAPYNDIFDITEIEGNIWSFSKAVKKTKTKDIQISFSANINLNGLMGILRFFGLLKVKKLVFREPSSPFLRYGKSIKTLKYKIMYYLGYSQCDFLIFQTDVMKKAFFENINLNIHSDVFLNPIDLKEVLDKGENGNIALNLKGNEYILAVGRFIPEKGFGLLIHAFSELSNKKLLLIILGSGQLQESYEKQVKELGISDRVVFPGFIKNPYPYMKKAKLCVVSSTIEGYPNTLLQMLVLNDRVLSTECCGNLNEIPHLLLIPPSNGNQLFSAMEDMVKGEILLNKKQRNDQTDYLESRNIEVYVNRLLIKLKEH